MRRNLPLKIYSVVFVIFLFMPVITVVVFSFSQTGTLPLKRLTLLWYRAVLSSAQYGSAFQSSALVAAATCLIGVTIGTLAAVAFHRYRSTLSTVVIILVVLPIALPPLVLGISLISLFKVLGVTLSLATVTVGHLLLTIPIVIITLYAAFANFDPLVEEAARDLGATPTQTFWRITFPAIRPSVVGAGLLVLAVSLDEFIVTLFTIGAQNTVPITIWGQMRIGVSPSVNALSTLLLLGTVALVVVTQRLAGATFAPRRT
jgi:spermidine/putrescine transport system permease protein